MGWVGGLPAQISGSPVLVVQVPKIFGVRRTVSQPMTGTRCWSEKPRGGGRWSLCWAPSWAPKVFEGAWWRWASYVWGTLHQTGDNNLIDIPWLPDANKIIIGQPDLKYHKIERTGSDNQKCSPSRQIINNQDQLQLHWWKSMLSSSLPSSSML